MTTTLKLQHIQKCHLKLSTVNYWEGGWGVWRELKLISRFVTLARFTYIQVIYPYEGPLTHQGSKKQTYGSGFNIEMKPDQHPPEQNINPGKIKM